MEEKIAQLEQLLEEILQLFEKHLRIEAITIEEYTNLVLDLEDDYYAVHTDKERGSLDIVATKLIEGMIATKKDRSFFDDDLPKLKILLSETLSKLSDTGNSLVEETRFGSRLKGPSEIFKKLLEQGLVSTETRIYGTFDHILYEGYLTEDGYFKLIRNATKTKLFSSLSTAASFICNKPILKGWAVWFAVDENGKEQFLEYFRNKITSADI